MRSPRSALRRPDHPGGSCRAGAGLIAGVAERAGAIVLHRRSRGHGGAAVSRPATVLDRRRLAGRPRRRPRRPRGRGLLVVTRPTTESPRSRRAASADPMPCCSTSRCPGSTAARCSTELKRDPELRDIPVVFLTGRTGTDDLVAGLRARRPRLPQEAVRAGRAARPHRQRGPEQAAAGRAAPAQRRTRPHGRVDALTRLYNRRHSQEELHRLARHVAA